MLGKFKNGLKFLKQTRPVQPDLFAHITNGKYKCASIFKELITRIWPHQYFIHQALLIFFVMEPKENGAHEQFSNHRWFLQITEWSVHLLRPNYHQILNGSRSEMSHWRHLHKRKP